MSLIRGSSEVITHLNSHREHDQIRNLEGAGKAQQWAKDPNKQAVVIYKKRSLHQRLVALIFRSSRLAVGSSDQTQRLSLGVLEHGFSINDAERLSGERQRGWHHVVLMQVLITPFTAATVTVLGESWIVGAAGQRKQRAGRGGLWYVRNAAKANRKPHTPVSNEINASSFPVQWGKSDRKSSIDRWDRLRGIFFFTVKNKGWICELNLNWSELRWACQSFLSSQHVCSQADRVNRELRV